MSNLSNSKVEFCTVALSASFSLKKRSQRLYVYMIYLLQKFMYEYFNYL